MMITSIVSTFLLVLSGLLQAGDDARAVVILKTQTDDYNNEAKSEVRTEYRDAKRINVPPDLSPQNKWVMFEGPVLENQYIAYRFYMDHRHRSDIYGKKVSDLVMDTVSWNYHDIMNWGSDILKVGDALGIGAPGVWIDNELHTISEYGKKTVRVLSSGGSKAEVEFTFKDVSIGKHKFDLTQRWSLNADSPLSEVVLKAGKGWPADARFATGFVKHLEESSFMNHNGVKYLWNWGRQSFHEQDMGMAIVVGEQYEVETRVHELNHLLLFESGNEVTYQFTAAWEEGVQGITNAEAFETNLKTITGGHE